MLLDARPQTKLHRPIECQSNSAGSLLLRLWEVFPPAGLLLRLACVWAFRGHGRRFDKCRAAVLPRFSAAAVPVWREVLPARPTALYSSRSPEHPPAHRKQSSCGHGVEIFRPCRVIHDHRRGSSPACGLNVVFVRPRLLVAACGRQPQRAHCLRGTRHSSCCRTLADAQLVPGADARGWIQTRTHARIREIGEWTQAHPGS